MPVKKYQCTSCCEKMFKSPSALRRHETKGQLNVSCSWPECGKRFSQKSALNDHIRMKHTKEKPRGCPFCPVRFSASYQVNDHMSAHHADRLWRCASALAKDGSCFYGGSRDRKTLAKHIESKHDNSRFEDLVIPPVAPPHAQPAQDSLVVQAMLDTFYSADDIQHYAQLPILPSTSATLGIDVTAWPLPPANAVNTPGYITDHSSSSGSTSLTSSPFPSLSQDLSTAGQEFAGIFDGWTPEFAEALQQSILLDFSIPLTDPQNFPPAPYPCQTTDPGYTQDSILGSFASYAPSVTMFLPSL